MRSTTGRLVVILAQTYITGGGGGVIFHTNRLRWHTSDLHTKLIYRPLLQPVWSPGQSHPCGQTGPESGRQAGTGISSDFERNLPLSGYSSKMLDCGLETQTLDSLQRTSVNHHQLFSAYSSFFLFYIIYNYFNLCIL